MAGHKIPLSEFRGRDYLISLPPPDFAQSTAAGDDVDPQHANGGAAISATGAPASAFLGSMLFTRCVSGTRVVPRGQLKSVSGVEFTGYGASVTDYPHDYLTAACAIGLSVAELDEFVVRLDKTLRKAKGGGERKGKGDGGKAASSAPSPGDATVGTAKGAETATAVTTGVATGVAIAAAAKARQGNGGAENGLRSHVGAEPAAEPGLNGGQSQPETETCLPECVEGEGDGDGDGEDWDDVD